MAIFAADLEATTDPEDCRVWAWKFESLINSYSKRGISLDSLLDCMLKEVRGTFYYHNLRYDGTFILTGLFNMGYKIFIDRTKADSGKKRKKAALPPGFIRTLITDNLKYYEIEVNSFTGNTIVIRDSLKLIPLSEAQIAKKFGLDTMKGEIDYNKFREEGYEPTKEEWEYLDNDVYILKRALNSLFDIGINKITIGASALADFKDILGGDFKTLFPNLAEYDAWLRPAYRGGYCIANPKYQGKVVGPGYVLDKNSMYPGVMVEKPLPFGTPIYFEGEYIPDAEYPLYIARVRLWLHVKEGHLPTVQVKHNPTYKPEEYIRHTYEEPLELHCTGQDLERIQQNYDCHIDYLGGYKFRASTKIFKTYVDKWYTVKEDADKSGDMAMRQIAKLMENNLYGKFGVRLIARDKVPYLSNGKILHRFPEQEIFETEGEEAAQLYLENADFSRKPVYLPVSIFVTSWARYEIIGLAQANYENFLYCDTDSLHILGDTQIEGIRLHNSALGAWKKEGEFVRGKYLRAKAYIEDMRTKEGTELVVHCAGMPRGCHKYVTFENFKVGTVFEGKLQHKNVIGGQVLIPTTFQIKS